MILRKRNGYHASVSNTGMTFVELLVVLLILAILSAVALRSTTGLAEQARHESTIRTLENIEEAILGPRPPMRQSHSNSPIITGFVADIGRLPRPVEGEPETPLQELWLQSGLGPFNVYEFQDPEKPSVTVTFPAGWRGPYLAWRSGQNALRDGWGNNFQYILDAEGHIINVISLGRDNILDPEGTGYDADVDLPGGEIDPEDYQATIDFEVTGANPQPSEEVVVRMYGPNPETGAPTVSDIVATEENGVWTAEFRSVTQGPRVFRAVQRDETVLTEVSKESHTLLLILLPGWNETQTLDMYESSQKEKQTPDSGFVEW